MVGKRGLTSKIFFLFFSVVFAAFAFITILVIYSLQNISRDEIYFRLNAYCDITYYDWSNGKHIKPSEDADYKYGIIQGKMKEEQIDTSEIYTINLDYYFEEEEVDHFLDIAIPGKNIVFDSDKGNIFYVFKIDGKTNNFVIMLVDDVYSNMFARRIVLQMIIIIIVVLVAVSFIVTLWINKLVKRIQEIQKHVSKMNKEEYKVSYIDDGDDELADLSNSIELMRLEIKESETTKREILQNVSHDFKTPISVIKSQAEALEDDIVTPQEAAKKILKQTDILKSKVNQLLQYNRLEYLSGKEEFEVVNLKDICKEVVDSRKNLTHLSFELNLDDCYFKGFRENFVTIIDNIVDNAIRYANSKIIITTKENKVTIYNDGEHIEEKFLNANFKAYEKGSKGQFGLGMSIVKKTCDFFGLTLKVFNEPYGGVSFVLFKKRK